MRCENSKYTMLLPQYLSKGRNMPYVIAAIDIFFFCVFNYIVNSTLNLTKMIKHPEHIVSYLGIENIFPKFAILFGSAKTLYLFFFVVLIVMNFIFVYKIHVSWNQAEIAHGQKGNERWTSKKEVREQYKEIPLKDEFFEGKGGTVIQRQGNKLYIDPELTNNLYIGTTRSGKGELYVFPLLDNLSRAKDLKDRPSIIVGDPKLENYRSSKTILEERGYKVLLLNLADPVHSAGYNPLQLIIEFYKKGETGQAQQRARTLGFSIFKSSNHTQEPLWEDSASDLFAAIIIAVCTDCLNEDAALNEQRKEKYLFKRSKWELLSLEQQAKLGHQYMILKENHKDYIEDSSVVYLPPEAEFYEIHPNEEKVNIYSVLYFFRDLCDRKPGFKKGNKQEREKIANTALDEYFNNRPSADFAKSLYQEVKTTGDKTKGSIYLVMQSAVSIFALDNIARLTAKNEINIEELGYGKQPVAIFMGIPFEDKSNWFIITSFICQAFQYLVFLAREKNGGDEGRLERDVRFILDEFGNHPAIEFFDSFVTVGLGLGISFDLFVQSLNQIEGKYKEFSKTILENMSYQIYIKSLQQDTQKAFSELLGNQTYVEIMRSGERFSMDKNYQESSSQKPLIYPAELGHLREGETVVYRGMKRTDLLGRAIISYPIINEYADDWTFIERQKQKKKLMETRDRAKERIHLSENRTLTFDEELSLIENDWKWENGTALRYRYQYLQDSFPNPGKIRLSEINPHNLENVPYPKLIYTHKDAFNKIAEDRERYQVNHLSFNKKQALFDNLEQIDPNWEKSMNLTKADTCSKYVEVISQSSLSVAQKEKLYSYLGR